jgi:periplasmic copper chaperone A
MNTRAWTICSRGLLTSVALAISPLLPASFLSAPAQAADYTLGAIHITQPWSRATPKGATSAAAYMTITNTGAMPDRVTCVSSNVAGECQIHSMTMEGGVMKMRPVEGGLEIKPGETVTLKPASFHVMLIDLKQPLEQGSTIKATLKFENAGTISVDYPVAAIGAPAPGADAGGGNMMQSTHGNMQMQSPGGMMQMNKQ